MAAVSKQGERIYVDYQRGMREPLKAKWPAFAEQIAKLTPNW